MVCDAINARIIENESDILSFEKTCCLSYIKERRDIKSYESLILNLKNCKYTDEYWQIIDFLRACYDFYSLSFKNIRFRIDGLDCPYRLNIWSDIDALLDELKNTRLTDFLEGQIRSIEDGTNLYGINITFESQLVIAILLCDIIKKRNPSSIICVGGGFVNSFIQSGNSIGPLQRYCDLVCNGEGEALLWYLNKYGFSKDALLSLGQASEDKAIYVEAKSLCTEKLDVFPPRIDDSHVKLYFSPKKIIPLRFTYQCYWGKCKFCTDKEVHYCFSKKYDYQRMIDYCITNAAKGTFEGIYFLDSAISAAVLKKFCEALIDNEIKISWGTNARFDRVYNDEKFIKLLADAGCTFIKFGLESGSQKVLDLMQKGTAISDAREIIALCRKNKILVHTYIMFAYPGETAEDRKLTEQFLLDDYSHPDNYNCSEFIMYGTSRIAKELNYDFKINMQEVGWHSSSFSFTNNQIKASISKMRQKFDKKFMPANMLISTGHTIAFAGAMTVRRVKIVLKTDSILKKSPYARVSFINEDFYCGVWHRKDCLSYIVGAWAKFIKDFSKGTVGDLIKRGLNTNTLFCLLDEHFLCIDSVGDGEALSYEGEEQIKIIHGSAFERLKWYGYYDAG